jgi:mobilization protein NikA
MMKPIQIRVDEADLTLWKHGAELAGLSVSEWIRRKCAGEEIKVAERTRMELPPEKQPALAKVTLAEVAEQTHSRRTSDSSVAGMVASRTQHEIGCDCMQCVQTTRFIEQERARQPKEEKPPKWKPKKRSPK